MTTLESTLSIDTTGFIIGGEGNYKDDQTIETDAARGTADMVLYTVMVRDATTEKLKPMTILTDITTESKPVGLLWQLVDAADIVAGDVTNQKLLVGGNIRVDEDKIILEGALALDDLITVPIGGQRTIRQALIEIGIIPQKTRTTGV